MRIIQPRRGLKSSSERLGSGRSNVEATVTASSSKKSKKGADFEDRKRSHVTSPETESPQDFLDLEKQTQEIKAGLLEQLPSGKKRRRSELISQTSNQPLELVVDDAKKEYNQLFASGVRMLAMREHSVKEITTKLSDKTDKADTVHAVVDELVEKKYLSDERFTESYIRARGNRGFGPVKIRSELKARGVSSMLIQDHLKENAGIWFDNAETQYQKKYGDAPVGDYGAWSKRARFMQSRGFTTEQIQSTVPDFCTD